VSNENGQNEWGVGFSLIMFLDKIVGGHTNVVSHRRYHDIVFDLVRKEQGDTLTVVCINEYTASLDVVMRVIEAFPSVNIIFIGGKWNKFTREAAEYCMERQIGICNSGDLAIALRKNKYWA
jgi:hypothetical protein